MLTDEERSAQQKRLARYLRDARRIKRLSQAELAKRIGRTQSFVTKYENEARSLDAVTLLEVCNVLRVNESELIDYVRGKFDARPHSER